MKQNFYVKNKNIFLSLLTLLSCSIYGRNITALIENKKALTRSLYNSEFDLSSLGYQSTLDEIQSLTTKRALLQHIITEQIGFFNNYDIAKGIVGTCLSTNCLLLSFLIMQPKLITLSTTTASIIVFNQNDLFKIIIPASFASFSLWIFKKSLSCLYRGWYKKENAIQELIKTEKLLMQYQNYIDTRFAIKLPLN